MKSTILPITNSLHLQALENSKSVSLGLMLERKKSIYKRISLLHPQRLIYISDLSTLLRMWSMSYH